MNLVRMQFGSHLYGTATENSDTDIKGVYMPTKRQIYLHDFPKCYSEKTKHGNALKNTSDDVDIEIYSLYYLFGMAMNGETVAIDMLHAPPQSWIETSWIWEIVYSHRKVFNSKDMGGLAKYARKQAAKYGIKGSRINALEMLFGVLSEIDDTLTLKSVWDSLPENEYLVKNWGLSDPEYIITGKRFIWNCKIGYIKEVVAKIRKSYGERAEMAANNEGIDWKAISHAFRAFYQFKRILVDGDFTYPLPEAEFLKQVKLAQLDFKTVAQPRLEALSAEIDLLAAKSDLPDKVNREECQEILYNLVQVIV